jgi:hypothetical protein
MLAGGKVVMVEHLRSFIQFHATTTFENTLPFVLGLVQCPCGATCGATD